jgi:hypothetical protein
VALGWLAGVPLLAAPAIFGAVGWLARAERDRPISAADSLVPGLRVEYLPPQSSDFTLSLVGPELAVITALLLLPPAVLCFAWLAARRRRPAA